LADALSATLWSYARHAPGSTQRHILLHLTRSLTPFTLCVCLRSCCPFCQTADATQYQATQENFAAELRRLGETLKAAKIEHRTRGRTAKQAEQRLHTLQEELKTLLEVRYMTTIALYNIDTMTDTLNFTQMLPRHVVTCLLGRGFLRCWLLNSICTDACTSRQDQAHRRLPFLHMMLVQDPYHLQHCCC
jgi:hypothetical protein